MSDDTPAAQKTIRRNARLKHMPVHESVVDTRIRYSIFPFGPRIACFLHRFGGDLGVIRISIRHRSWLLREDHSAERNRWLEAHWPPSACGSIRLNTPSRLIT